MVRASIVSFAAVLVLGCADVGGGEDTNPFGDGTTGQGMATAASDPSGAEATTAGTGEATGMPTTAAPTTEAPTTDEPPPGTDDATSAPGDTSGGNGGQGTLGECLGIGAWESCAQACEAVTDTCVEAGCDGATVVYYPDVGACTALRDGNGAATPCAEPFAMGGGASFARCCCQ